MIPTVAQSLSSLQPWVDAGIFGPSEVHGAEVITRASVMVHDHVLLGAALALWAPLHGHVCIDLAIVHTMVRAEAAVESDLGPGTDPTVHAILDSLAWPNIHEWVSRLAASPLVRVVNAADPQPVLNDQPLVLSDHRLYTQRQWVDECTVAAALRSRAENTTTAALSETAGALLERLLPRLEQGEPNLQHTAAVMALSSRVGVIVGGPGTGKTHTVARLLAVMLTDAAQGQRPLHIALAAPTGKAAARLRQAIAGAAGATADGSTVLPPAIAEQLEQMPATTLHRLLGSHGLGRTRFVHNAQNQLPHDVVIIDETSMVALPLMARLLEAVRPEATLILVGDPDQLESIDVGAVLADIVQAADATTSPLHHHVVRLRRPRRQQSGSPIASLSDAIRENRADEVVGLLRSGATDPVSGEPLLAFVETDNALDNKAQSNAVRDVVLPPCALARNAAVQSQAADALRALAGIRVLCAHRHGAFGAETWNQMIETWLLGRPPSHRFYPGRALLVTRNDQRTQLSNGDTGIVVAHPDGVRAAFGVGDNIREFAPAQLEDIDTAFAMTIHKSQGSEYATVVVVLPPSTSPLIGRELLYTAVTRTTRRLIVIGTEAAVIAAVSTPGRRVTGLTSALKGTSPIGSTTSLSE
jgi:exodeoxyribonuclease V alpha subunit